MTPPTHTHTHTHTHTLFIDLSDVEFLFLKECKQNNKSIKATQTSHISQSECVIRGDALTHTHTHTLTLCLLLLLESNIPPPDVGAVYCHVFTVIIMSRLKD